MGAAAMNHKAEMNDKSTERSPDRQRGAVAVEYGLIALLIATAAIVGMGLVGTEVASIYRRMSEVF